MTALSFFTQMQEAMDAQAVEIWNMVEYSRASGHRLRLGEVSITELNFYRLRDFWTQKVYIETNEPKESTTGADWEWIIGHNDQWVQIRVQAKIVNRTGSFTELGHPPNSRRRQMDRLIDPPAADVACRWMPIYVFYLADPPATLPNPTGAHHDSRKGCSAHLARHVRDIYGPHQSRATLTSTSHLPGSIRWASIFDGLITRLKSGESMDSIMASLANQKLPKNISGINQFWDHKFTDGPCGGQLPAYLQAIIDQRGDDFDNANFATLKVDFPSPEKTPTSNPKEKTERDEAEPDSPDAGASEKESPPDSEEVRDIPVRTVALDQSMFTSGESTLPHLVSVINIDRLPDIDWRNHSLALR